MIVPEMRYLVPTLSPTYPTAPWAVEKVKSTGGLEEINRLAGKAKEETAQGGSIFELTFL
jgi:hypothetical protein